jgi:hypothetical protein
MTDEPEELEPQLHAGCGGEIQPIDEESNQFRCSKCNQIGTDIDYDHNGEVILYDGDAPAVQRADAF